MRTPRRLIFALAGLMVATGTALSATAVPASAAEAVTTAQASAASPAFTPCQILCPFGHVTNFGSGKCIEPVPGPDGNYAVNGLAVEQFTCQPSPSLIPLWSIIPIADVHVSPFTTRTAYHIVNWQSRQCLDDRDGRTSDRSPVQQWTCGTSTTMLWVLGDSLGGARQLMNLRALQNGGSACLDVANGSGSDGAVLQLYHCTAQNTAQHFFVPGH
jgi:Ricin-type beta-trefoil lectin domain-like